MQDMASTRLIVSGDDFGISREANEAIVRAYREGVLTSCSLMVSGEAFQDAVQRAKEHPGLGVGLHLVTVMGRSVLPHAAIPHLVDRQGNFSSDPTRSGLRYFFLPAVRRELRRELRAQFERFAATGLKCSHIDSHLHMHIHPVIFQAAMELAARFGVRRMRLPRDDLGLALQAAPEDRIAKALGTFIFHLLTRTMRQKLRERGFCFPHRVYGHLMSGRMREDYVLSVLRGLPRGKTSEIYFHPAVYPAGRGLSPRAQQYLREFNILISRQVIRGLEELEIQRISYNQMEKGQ